MSDHRSIPTHAEMARLTRTVRGGRLDDEQREQLAQLLDTTVGSAVRVTPTMVTCYPGQPERAAAGGLGCWDAVPGAYAALLEGDQQQRVGDGGS